MMEGRRPDDAFFRDTMRRRRLRHRAFLLEYVTVGWNIFEGIAAVAIGLAAGSVALVGFGLDSMVEVFASLVVVWELHDGERRRERPALRLIGGGYLVVAAYILWDAIHSVATRDHPSGSPIGVVLTSATVLVMTALAVAKRWTGTHLDSRTVLADARFSLIDGLLASTVLSGLVLNLILGWWWADPMFAIVIALAAGREGIESFKHGDAE
jgi:divalent metal cation (Fe/Co/Zn/Cd) transporter